MRQNGISHILELAHCVSNEQVGGKAVNLGRLVRAGFPVPGGFAITTEAYYQSRKENNNKQPLSPADDLKNAIIEAYAALGRPTVAVRSSATAEDQEEASMAGQYETVLNVQDDESLIAAVEKCWASLESQRTSSYLAQYGLEAESVAMGVVVQKQAAADIAGVLFTTNPRAGAMDQALIEASWGLGESVVSGKVQPDTMILDQETGKVLNVVIGSKETWLPPDGRSEQTTETEKQKIPCLNASQVMGLWHLGRRVAAYFQSPQDIEWAIENDHIYLLQTRAITTIEEIEAQELCLNKNRQHLRDATDKGQGAWVRHNLDETLPHPTPLTWSVISGFMKGSGGFGNLYRKVGFAPSSNVCKTGFLELIAGRIYMDLSRSSELFFENFPYTYDLDYLRNNPGASQEPPTLPTGSFADRYQTNKRLQEVNNHLDKFSEDFDQKFDNEITPEFTAWIKEEKKRELSNLTTREWRELWLARQQRVMDEFAPNSLLPTFLLTRNRERLREFLSQNFWNDSPDTLLQQLSSGGKPDLTVLSMEKLYQVETENDSEKFNEWLKDFGHRAPLEFELGTPRWRERPDEIRKMARNLSGDVSPLQRYQQQTDSSLKKLSELKEKLTPQAAEELSELTALVHRYQRFREDGKHYLMMGYDLLRDMVIEAQRRLDIENANLLSFDELHDALTTGFAPLHLLRERERQRRAESRLTMPTLITKDDLAALGESTISEEAESGQYRGLSVSGGKASGPVRIVLSPNVAEDLGNDYVLVCPSTDPNWTPLFTNAAAIVLECGGSLSHGAVVAREMGVPAVVIPDATRLLNENENITVNGEQGVVTRRESDTTEENVIIEDESIPYEKMPPPPGRFEQKTGQWRNRFFLLWAVFFAAFYGLPENWIQQPVYGIMDYLLLPVAASIGWTLTVVLVAGLIAILCMLGQLWLTDTPRLREAKRRIGELQKEAKSLSADSEKRKQINKLSNQVQGRTLLASFVPIAIILGPMMLTFFWMPKRVPALWHNPKPGIRVNVKALVDGEYTDPIKLKADPALKIDTAITPQEQSNPPIRETLEALKTRWRFSDSAAEQMDLPWDVRTASQWARMQELKALSAYLKRNIAPREISWMVQTPDEKGGRYPIEVITTGEKDKNYKLSTFLVLGPGHSPEPREIIDPYRPLIQEVQSQNKENPVRKLEVVYIEPSRTRSDNAFYSIGAPFGWLITYLIAYLPILFILRGVLRVP